MFGFLRGACGDADYRRTYARCCRLQRLWFGARSAPVLSYECVFAYQLAREAQGWGALPAAEPTCCRFRGAGKLAGAVDAPLGRFCGALGLLLVSVKLDDDVRDDRSLVARLARAWLRRPIREAFLYFENLDGGAADRFAGFVDAHVTLERRRRRATLDDFARSTAEGFGYAFSLLGQADRGLRPHTDAFAEVGRCVGAAIVAADCAADWRRDLRRGLPNPVRTAAAAVAARTEAQRLLSYAGWTWSEHAPTASIALRTLRAAVERLNCGEREVAPQATARRKRGWRAYRLARAGDCDYGGLDCISCDGCGGCGGCDGGADAGGCFGGGRGDVEGAGSCVGCCDPLYCFVECGDGSCWRRTSKRSRRESLEGRHGYANGALGTKGLVVVDGRSYPARTEGEVVPGGTKVLVVSDDEFGVVVRRLQSDEDC